MRSDGRPVLASARSPYDGAGPKVLKAASSTPVVPARQSPMRNRTEDAVGAERLWWSDCLDVIQSTVLVHVHWHPTLWFLWEPIFGMMYFNFFSVMGRIVKDSIIMYYREIASFARSRRSLRTCAKKDYCTCGTSRCLLNFRVVQGSVLKTGLLLNLDKVSGVAKKNDIQSEDYCEQKLQELQGSFTKEIHQVVERLQADLRPDDLVVWPGFHPNASSTRGEWGPSTACSTLRAGFNCEQLICQLKAVSMIRAIIHERFASAGHVLWMLRMLIVRLTSSSTVHMYMGSCDML